MTGRVLRVGLYLLVLLASSMPLPAQAQERGAGDDAPVSPEQLRTAMKQHFRNALRAELALSDEQMEEILPRVEQGEEARRQAREERTQIVRRLRRGLGEGASDAELREMLDRLDRIELEEQELERSIRADVDELLTVRQSVQFRFFTQRFRREVQRRIREFQEDRVGAPLRRQRGRRP